MTDEIVPRSAVIAPLCEMRDGPVRDVSRRLLAGSTWTDAAAVVAAAKAILGPPS